MSDLWAAYQRQMLNVAFALAALAGVAGLAWLIARIGARIWRPLERGLGKIASRRALAIGTVGVVSLVVGWAVTFSAGPPIPHIHDEFSYLLAGDTFASGRVTNPPHPKWKHFETMHELFEPTYASKFHPAQGLTLAFGQVVFGAPWVGVVGTMALACAALTWALFGWTRPSWALLGGLIAAVHPQIVIWGHQYWGGGVGMLGGSLVFGALPRIVRSEGVAKNAAWLSLGGVILAASRPFEAMVWGLISAVSLGASIAANRGKQTLRLVIPSAAVIVPALAMLGYYNWRITHRATEMPYTLHTRAYMSVPLFFWQDDPPPRTYLHQPLADQHLNFERRYFHDQKSIPGWARYAGWKLYSFAELHLLRNLALLVGVLAIPCALSRIRSIRMAAVYAAAFLAAYAGIPWFEHHYVGAIMALFFALAISGLRVVHAWRPARRRVGQSIVWICTLSTLPVLTTVVAREYRNTHGGWWVQRQHIVQKLTNEPGQHLVFVHYSPQHISGQEWVFNAADIDSAKIVWAREMSPAEDRDLVDYYPNRRVWIVYADESPPRLEPHPGYPNSNASRAITSGRF